METPVVMMPAGHVLLGEEMRRTSKESHTKDMMILTSTVLLMISAQETANTKLDNTFAVGSV
jgi:hypothetical protein